MLEDMRGVGTKVETPERFQIEAIIQREIEPAGRQLVRIGFELADLDDLAIVDIARDPAAETVVRRREIAVIAIGEQQFIVIQFDDVVDLDVIIIDRQRQAGNEARRKNNTASDRVRGLGLEGKITLVVRKDETYSAHESNV